MTRRVTARAPGKVNIALLVGDVRPDGYHPLASVFHAVSMDEQVTVELAPPGSGIRIASVTGPQAELVPTDDAQPGVAGSRRARPAPAPPR